MSTDRPITPGHAANQAAVAIDLADALADLPGGRDPDVVAELPARAWRLAAVRAGCKPGYVPSEQTRATVIALIRRRRNRPPDAFAGFPR